MREMHSLLAKRETKPNFDPLKNRIGCYAHIINVCSSHIISSIISASKPRPSKSKKQPARIPVSDDDSDDDISDGWDDGEPDGESDSDFVNDAPDEDASEDELDFENDDDNDKLPISRSEWMAGLRRNPIKRARGLVHF